MYISIKDKEASFEYDQKTAPVRADPRAEMAARLPKAVQPFLTWLTAKPAPGEPITRRSPYSYVAAAVILTIGGCVMSFLAMLNFPDFSLLSSILLPTGLVLTTSGLGLFQVVIFHHCAHNTVFRTQETNLLAGRMISALLLFKYFDAYKHEHLLHHSPKIQFTDQDEFSDFMVNMCGFPAGQSRRKLWLHLIGMLVSPSFHAKFLYRRIRGSLGSENWRHNALGITFWCALLIASAAYHWLMLVSITWVLPVSVLLQIATVFRILCEHRVPEPEILAAGGRTLVSQATSGVMPGAAVPSRDLPAYRSVAAWSLWWLNMLTVQLFVRVFVLVGDAPCHDFHHRRPGHGWTSYIQGRQSDMDAGSPGFPSNYLETWGLFRAVDANFALLAQASPSALRRPSKRI